LGWPTRAREERKGSAQLGPHARKGNRPVRAVFQAEKRRGQFENELGSLANRPKGEKVKFILFIFFSFCFPDFQLHFQKSFKSELISRKTTHHNKSNALA
jgi:hypothetical protein